MSQASPTVRANYERIRNRILAACDRAGRDPGEIQLIGAAKRQPVERMQAAWEAGLACFGENRVQEAEEKRPHLPPGARWHLIGPLQSNKAKRAAALFEAVHSVDRLKIGRLLDRHAGELGRRLQGFLEVNLGREETKHGFDPEGLADLTAPLAELENIRIVGLMAIPPWSEDLEDARRWFRRLRQLRDDLFSRSVWSGRPGFLSMGMSADFEAAIEEGATHVRVGTALFGRRPD